MPLWQRIVVTLVAIVVVSWGVATLVQSLFGLAVPSYASGVVGGLAALPVWEFLKRVRPRR
jgi:uncharacterized YccA/Bax inhibitor family protein